jgi:hypothetical protein
LNPGREDAVRFAEVAALGRPTRATWFAWTHEWVLQKSLRVNSTPAWKPTDLSRREEIFSLNKNFARYQPFLDAKTSRLDVCSLRKRLEVWGEID